MEDWKDYKIGDICSKVCSGGTPSSKHTEYYDGNIPWLNTKEINFNRIFCTEKCITEEGLNNSSAKWIEENSVIVAMYGATAGKTAIAKIPLTTNQACCNLTINHSVADYRFVYYYLSYKFIELASLANGGAQQNLNAQIIKDFEINLPSLHEQELIANVLSSLDDKIEVNRRINDNLEQQAQALFKSWFVDFEPFKNGEFVESELGMIPKGWRVYKLSEFLPVITGKKDANVAQGGNYPFFSCSQDYGWTDSYSFEGNAILVAGNGDFNVKMYNGKFEAYQRTYVLIPYNPLYTAWLFYAVKFHLDEITSAARGSVIKFITKGNLADFQFAAPAQLDALNIIIKFDSIRRMIATNNYQSRRLAELRDTLLPKLMSGELKVTNMDLVNEMLEKGIR